MPKAYEVTILKKFSNFEVLKHIIVISDQRPQPEQLDLKEKDRVMETREIQAEVIIVK